MNASPEVRILIVEDDPYFQRVLHKRLQKDGYQVQTAGDGREGMKAIVAWEPHLVISDWMMPEVDGLELCQSVKTGLREAAPYFILLTARGELSDRLLGLETGADDYVIKPCEQAELMARVKAGLRVIMLTRELQDTVVQLRDVQNGNGNGHAPLPELIAICSHCHKIRTEENVWLEAGEFLTTRLHAKFTDGTCPGCASARDSGDEPRKASGA
jgi:CheY-like chemotaxis protein